jgi:hypothetical protein
VIEPPHHLEVLVAGQILVDRGVLSGQADALPHLVGLLYDVESRDLCCALIRLEQG